MLTQVTDAQEFEDLNYIRQDSQGPASREGSTALAVLLSLIQDRDREGTVQSWGCTRPRLLESELEGKKRNKP